MIDQKITCHYCNSLVVLIESEHVKKYEKFAQRQLSCGAFEFKTYSPAPLVIFHIGYILPQRQDERLAHYGRHER